MPDSVHEAHATEISTRGSAEGQDIRHAPLVKSEREVNGERLAQTLSNWLTRLESAHPQHIELGLDRIKTVAHRFIPLSFDCPVILVAGTNGKGSTVEVLAHLLQHEGLTVGVYTSPHLFRFNERIRVFGPAERPISDEDLIQALEVVESHKHDTSLTYFEHTTLAALYYFHQLKPDAIILEVGMGGRLDATNIIEPTVSIITSIGLDHQAYLGNTKEAIAKEKAGVMRSNKPIISPERMLKPHAEALQAKWIEPQAYPANINSTLIASNIACAVTAFETLGYRYDATIHDSLIAQISIPGRRQWVMHNGRPILLDVSHNEDGLNALIEYLNNQDIKDYDLVFGCLQDKTLTEPLQRLANKAGAVHLVTLDTPRSMTKEGLRALLPGEVTTVEKALIASSASYPLIVCGSFYTVSEMYASL